MCWRYRPSGGWTGRSGPPCSSDSTARSRRWSDRLRSAARAGSFPAVRTRASPPNFVRPTPSASSSERLHIDREPVLHVRPGHSLVGLIDLLDRDHLDVGGDAVLAA